MKPLSYFGRILCAFMAIAFIAAIALPVVFAEDKAAPPAEAKQAEEPKKEEAAPAPKADAPVEAKKEEAVPASTPQLPTEAKKELIANAEKGDAQAQFELSLAYSSGDGVKVDLTESFNWCKKAAEQGNVDAQFLLAQRYATGTGVDANITEYSAWTRRAAEAGYVHAQFSLAMECFHGSAAVPKDLVQAFKWFSLATQQGQTAARDQLAPVKAEMTPEQVKDAEKQIADFKPKTYKKSADEPKAKEAAPKTEEPAKAK